VREALGLTGFDFVIGITAGLRPEKNHVQLLEAVAKLRTNNIRARAVLIGDGNMRGVIEARARALDIAEHVKITGFQSDVRPYLLACDTAVLCSLTEAFSLAAIEAMALGKPVVHSAVGGAAEMIRPGWNGFLFPVNDTACLVEKLTLLADRTLCQRLGKNARALVSSSFAESTMIERYEQLLFQLSGRGAAPSPHTAGIVAHGSDNIARRF
jgi:glycosyltransferase involved in cell wall biosynthesis